MIGEKDSSTSSDRSSINTNDIIGEEFIMQMLDLVTQYKQLKPELDEAIQRVLQSGQFIMGPELKALEDEVADYLGVSYGIGCASGTDALQVALMGHDIGPGDEVITTAFTFVATVEVIALLGATPVYVDIDPGTYTIAPEAIEEAITEKTRAIIPVHLYGQCAKMEAINGIAQDHNLMVIEDVAQAIGAQRNGEYAGSLGDVGCISFFPTKNLGAYGDGGMMVTDDEQLANKLRMITKHGSQKKYNHEILGVNSRLDAIQAAVLRVKLPHLSQWNQQRAEKASYYSNKIESDAVILPKIAQGNTHVFHQYSIQVPDRDALREYLGDRNIPTAIHYPIPLHKQPAFQDIGRTFDLSNSNAVADKIISLPIYPEMPTEDQDIVIDSINTFLS